MHEVRPLPATGPAGLVLRPFEPQDAEALAVILPPLLAGDWTAAGLLTLQAQHQLRVLALPPDQGSGLVGFAEFMQVLDEGHLINIAIAPLWQGRGLGTLLLSGIWNEMRKSGCRHCLLEVRRSNVAAQRLYERLGFSLDGVRKRYYRAQANQPAEDALLYSLSWGGESS